MIQREAVVLHAAVRCAKKLNGQRLSALKRNGEMMDIIDIVDKWCSNNFPVTCGLLLLATAFLLSFLYKTAWGEWKKRER